MPATVYLTRGTKYHLDPACPLMVNGENLWDSDSEGWFHFAGSYRRQEPNATRAAMCGKLPCLHCVPAEQRAFPPLYGQDFGHRPITGSALGVRGTFQVCARCHVRQGHCWLDEWETPHYSAYYVSVRWPCTSAIVLGLAERPVDDRETT